MYRKNMPHKTQHVKHLLASPSDDVCISKTIKSRF